MSEWIKCSDRMAPEEEWVLIYGPEDPVKAGYWYFSNFSSSPDGAVWFDLGFQDYVNGKITHWMPYPEGPTE